jgi:pimeloyl-ACP methyl ester carboxylesterase
MKKYGPCVLYQVTIMALLASFMSAQAEPGRLVSLGRYSLNIHCSGHGSPVVVVEGGLGDFASDWDLVQQRVETSQRICTYDRAGYGSSEVGPMPRTFAQLNLELHELLRRAGEKPPYILVGHSFGGSVVRNYAAKYPDEVAGMILAESVSEHQPLVFGGKAVLLKDSATHRAIPEPSLTGQIPSIERKPMSEQAEPLPEDYLALPAPLQELHRRLAMGPALEVVENSQREWSPEYFAEWDQHPQTGLLGNKPLVVLTRAS